MATLNLPAWGYGIRYSYGMFRQASGAGRVLALRAVTRVLWMAAVREQEGAAAGAPVAASAW
jgi:glucan phosphorylase